MLWRPSAPTPEEIADRRKHHGERLAVYRDEGHDREAAMRFVVDSAGQIRPPVLDVGTGQGLVAMELARRGLPVASVDVEEEYLRVAHLNAVAAGLDSRPRA